QSLGGARRADFRPPLLRPVPPGTSARAHGRSSTPLATARVKNSQPSSRLLSHQASTSPAAVAGGRRRRDRCVSAHAEFVEELQSCAITALLPSQFSVWSELSVLFIHRKRRRRRSLQNHWGSPAI